MVEPSITECCCESAELAPPRSSGIDGSAVGSGVVGVGVSVVVSVGVGVGVGVAFGVGDCVGTA